MTYVCVKYEIKSPSSPTAGDAVYVEARDALVGRRWAIICRGYCLNKMGDWEFEPIPSSRSLSFFDRCRWEDFEDAVLAAEKADRL